MVTKPALTLYVTTDCSSCTRTEEVLRGCEQIMSLVRLEILLLGGDGVARPANVIGAPTLVFQGEIVGLGTPDCIKLAAKLKAFFPVDALN